MSNSSIVQEIAKDQLKNNIPEFSVGDTVRVHVRIVEGATEAVKGGGAKTAEKGKKSGGAGDCNRPLELLW